MSGKVSVWSVALVAALVSATVCTVLPGREAVGQGDGSAAHLIALMGAMEDNVQTVCIVDAREQVLLVYEYGLGRGSLDFVAARTFKSDKLVEEYDTRKTGGRPLSVRDVKKLVK